jgi:hypothetical protein
MSSRDIISLGARQGLLAAVGIIVSCAGFIAFTVPAAHAAAATNANVTACNKTSFFGLEPWYQYLGTNLDPTTCEVTCFNVTDQVSPSAGEKCGDGKSDIPLVLLAVVDDLLRVAALAATGFIMYGAFLYVTSQGDPEGTGRAQKTIINALAGLAVAMTAVAIISFIGKRVGSP